MAKTMKRPIVLDAANSQFSELPGGQFVDAGAIPLDTSSEGNLLKTTDDGLAVQAADAVSSAPENVLEVRDGKLYVPDNSVTAVGLVSMDSGNKLRVGTDAKLFVGSQVVVSDDDDNLLSSGRDGGARLTPNDMLSNGNPNLLRIDPTDNKIILTQEDITSALEEAPSRDPGNLIVAGTDGGYYLSVGKLLGSDNTILHADCAGKLDADLSLRYSTGTGQLDILGHDGVTVVSSVVVPTSTSSLRSTYLVDGKPDVDGEAVEGDYYVSIAMQYGGIYDNGGALKFRGRKSTPAEVSFEYIVNDEHSGVWPAAMKAAFLSNNKTKAVSRGEATTITFDDGSILTITWTGLSGVKLSGTASFTPAVGIEQGTYIRMVYLLADTDVSDVYVNMSELVDVYLPGNGITIYGDTISVRPKLDGGVMVGPDGVSVDEEWLAEKVEGQQLAAGDGISLSGTTVSVKPKTSGGISVDAGGVGMKVKSASGLTVGADGLAAVAGDGIAFSETGAIIAKLLANGGLAIKRATGEIYVDFSLLPADMLQDIVHAMVQEGGGLAVDENGQLYVDFSTMPTDKFETMLKSIRVPIWLTRPLTIYVATTGSDTLDDGRGLTEDKPFATLQAALNYVSDTYNLSRYNVTVRLAEGDYGRRVVSLPSYTASTGEIYIQGADANDKEKTKIGRVNLAYSQTYHFVDLTCKPEGTNVATPGISPSAGFLYLQNVMVDISETVMVGSANLLGLSTTLTGTIYINATAADVPNGVTFKVSEACQPSVLLNTSGGQIIVYADINVVGSTTMKSAFALARQLGKVQFLKSASSNPGRLPVITVADGGQVTGVRYVANLNGIIDTSGQGAEFLPGTTAGRTDTGGQYN